VSPGVPKRAPPALVHLESLSIDRWNASRSRELTMPEELAGHRTRTRRHLRGEQTLYARSLSCTETPRRGLGYR
jgi:hypothetical protein